MKFLRQTNLHFFARHEEKESIPHETEPKAEKAYLGKRLNRVVNALAASINDGELRFGARRRAAAPEKWAEDGKAIPLSWGVVS